MKYTKTQTLKNLEQALKKDFSLHRGTEFSAGFDLFTATQDKFYLSSNEVVKVPTGISVEIPENYFGLITLRSSVKEFCLTNGVGIIDADYRGEIILSLRNLTSVVQILNPGMKIAQLLLVPVSMVKAAEVLSLTSTARGTGGFGSTGE